mgnify:CR=1 FL=1
MITNKCRAHLAEVNETAVQHMFHSLGVAVTLQCLVPLIVIHSFIPRFFTRTGTNVMKNIIKDRTDG